MDRCGGIYRVTVPFGRKKTNGLGGDHGVLVQAMAESADYAQDVNFSGGAEQDFELNLAFDFETARLFGIGGARLGEDLSGGGGRWTGWPCGYSGGSCGYGVSEAAAANLSEWG